MDQIDDDNVAGDDLVKILKDDGVPEDEVEAIQAYFRSVLNYLSTSFVSIADQFLKELDENTDQQISREELYGIRGDIFQGSRFYRFRLEKFPEAGHIFSRFTLGKFRDSTTNFLAILANILDDPIY